MNIKKGDIKDMVYQMIISSIESNDVAFDETLIEEADKKYAYEIMDKWSEFFVSKIKDDNFKSLFSTDDLVEYGQLKAKVKQK